MAFITKSELAPFKKVGIIENKDFAELAKISRKKKLKIGETGFSNVQMRNFTIEGHTCSQDVKDCILNYFTKKLTDLKKTIDEVQANW